MLGALSMLGSVLTQKCPACVELEVQGRRCASCDEQELELRPHRGRDAARYLHLFNAFQAHRAGKAPLGEVLAIAVQMQQKAHEFAVDLKGGPFNKLARADRALAGQLLRNLEGTEMSLAAFVSALRQGDLFSANNRLDALHQLMLEAGAIVDNVPA